MSKLFYKTYSSSSNAPLISLLLLGAVFSDNMKMSCAGIAATGLIGLYFDKQEYSNLSNHQQKFIDDNTRLSLETSGKKKFVVSEKPFLKGEVFGLLNSHTTNNSETKGFFTEGKTTGHSTTQTEGYRYDHFDYKINGALGGDTIVNALFAIGGTIGFFACDSDTTLIASFAAISKSGTTTQDNPAAVFGGLAVVCLITKIILSFSLSFIEKEVYEVEKFDIDREPFNPYDPEHRALLDESYSPTYSPYHV